MVYNQTEILDEKNRLLPSALEEEGTPFFSDTYAMFLFTTNLTATATISHLVLELGRHQARVRVPLAKQIARGLFPAVVEPEVLAAAAHGRRGSSSGKDPKYRLMLAYPECPGWWYICILVLSVVMGLAVTYAAESTLPWYGFLTSVILAGTFILFFGAQVALTGYWNQRIRNTTTGCIGALKGTVK